MVRGSGDCVDAGMHLSKPRLLLWSGAKVVEHHVLERPVPRHDGWYRPARPFQPVGLDDFAAREFADTDDRYRATEGVLPRHPLLGADYDRLIDVDRVQIELDAGSPVLPAQVLADVREARLLHALWPEDVSTGDVPSRLVVGCRPLLERAVLEQELSVLDDCHLRRRQGYDFVDKIVVPSFRPETVLGENTLQGRSQCCTFLFCPLCHLAPRVCGGGELLVQIISLILIMSNFL